MEDAIIKAEGGGRKVEFRGPAAEGWPLQWRAGRFSGQFSETQSDPNHASRKLVAFNDA